MGKPSWDTLHSTLGGMLGIIGAAGALFAFMGQERADKDLVKALLGNDWKTAIARARTLARHRPFHWANINLIVEQAAARAGHPVGKRGHRLKKLQAEIRMVAPGHVSHVQKEWFPSEVLGRMMDPVVVVDPLTQQPWCVAERPFVGNRVGSWVPDFARLLAAAEALVGSPGDPEAMKEISKISRDYSRVIKNHNEMNELARTDMEAAKRRAHKVFLDAFMTDMERNKEKIRRAKHKKNMTTFSGWSNMWATLSEYKEGESDE